MYIYLISVKGLNPVQATLLLSLQEFLLIFLEVPTGVVADKISRKFSVGLGYIVTALPFLFLPWASQFYVYVLIFTIKAVGKAFVSGAAEALLFDTLVDLNQTHQYKRITNKSKSIMMGVTAACIFLGGLMAQKNIELTLILPFPLMMMGAVAVFLMKEPDVSKKAKQLQDRNYLIHTLQALRFMVNKKSLMILALIFAITEGVALNMKWYYTPIFEALKFDLALIGGVTAALYVAKSLLAAVSVKLFKNEQNQKNIVVFSGLNIIAFMIPVIMFRPTFVVIALLVIILLNEALLSMLQEEIHYTLDSHNRATVMSMVNLISSLIATVTLVGFGFFQLHWGVKAALAFIAGTFVVSTLMSAYRPKFRQAV